MKFSGKDFFSKCDQIRSFLQIWSHLLKKSLMENFIFCAETNLAPSLHLWRTFSLSLPGIQSISKKAENYVKSVQIRSFFWSVFSRIWTEFSVFSLGAGKYGPEKTPYLDTFHAMENCQSHSNLQERWRLRYNQ